MWSSVIDLIILSPSREKMRKGEKMTDKEWIAQIKTISNKELFNALESSGYDSYYSDIYNAALEELERRLNDSDVEMEKQLKSVVPNIAIGNNQNVYITINIFNETESQ